MNLAALPRPMPAAGRRGSKVTVRRTVTGAVAVMVATAATAIAIAAASAPGQPRLRVAGVAQDPCQPVRALPVPVQLGGMFDPDSSIVRLPGGAYAGHGRPARWTPTETACAAATDRASRGWLASGLIPGITATQRAMATRALLDLRLAVRPDGAVLAGWHQGWRYAWPRDSSWTVAALAGTGHPAMAYRVLRFLQRTQESDGTWAARYAPDGSGPVRDGRPAELDAVGWVPWAVWSWAATQRLQPGDQSWHQLARLWPMVTRAADAAARSLTRDGLPVPAMDYWEDSVEVTLGTAAPLLTGLRAAADLAADLGADPGAGGRDSGGASRDDQRWTAASRRLANAIAARFGPAGYSRTPASGSGADAAVTFLGPPFSPAGPRVLRAAGSARRALAVPNGGLRPGANWPGTAGVAWTPETAFFALFDAATGQHAKAAALLDWLAAHRTQLGELPEKVNSSGEPASVAPLAWTDAVTLLALAALNGRVRTVPVPG